MIVLREFSERQKNGRLKYFIEVQCKCGNTFKTRKDGHTKSCGCLQKELNKTRRLGKPALNRLKSTERAIERIAKNVYRQSSYDDSDISFEEFLILSKKRCFYRDCLPANQSYLGIKKDGSARKCTRTDKDGNKYQAIPWGFYLGKDAVFAYNGLDRIDPTLLHSKDNVVTCCKTCNFMKTNKTLSVFLSQVEKIYKCRILKNN